LSPIAESKIGAKEPEIRQNPVLVQLLRDSLTLDQGTAVFDQVKEKMKELILKIRGEHKNAPIVFVGGGAALLPSGFFQEEHQIPAFFNVANAYGAALAEISGTIDTIVSLQNRTKVLDDLCETAKEKAIAQGADKRTLRVVDQQIIPYSYVPNQMARVIIRYSGKREATLEK
jgi:hypothetical protein